MAITKSNSKMNTVREGVEASINTTQKVMDALLEEANIAHKAHDYQEEGRLREQYQGAYRVMSAITMLLIAKTKT